MPEELALAGELVDHGAGRVGGPDIAGGIHPDAVRNLEEAFARGAKDAALTVGDNHRVRLRASLQQVDCAAGLHRDGGDHFHGPACVWGLDRKRGELQRQPRRSAHEGAKLFRLRGKSLFVGDLRAQRQGQH